MRQQADFATQLRQVVKRAHRHLHLVANAVAVDDDFGGIFVVQRAREFADHFLPIMGDFFKKILQELST